MAVDPDEEPRKVKPQKRDLTPMSIEELRDYIADMKEEILRVEAAISSKQGVRSGADALFKKK